MKTPKKTNRPKTKLLLLLGLALIAAGLLGFWLYQRSTDDTRPMNDIEYRPATEEEKQAVDEHKQNLAEEEEKTDEPSNEPATISLTITRASQNSAGQPLNIRTLIAGTTAGTCEVTLTKSGQTTVSRTFEVVFEATSARCLDADIPASAFGASGEWNLKVTVKNGAQTSNPVEQAVTITK